MYLSADKVLQFPSEFKNRHGQGPYSCCYRTVVSQVKNGLDRNLDHKRHRVKCTGAAGPCCKVNSILNVRAAVIIRSNLHKGRFRNQGRNIVENGIDTRRKGNSGRICQYDISGWICNPDSHLNQRGICELRDKIDETRKDIARNPAYRTDCTRWHRYFQ